MPITGEYDLQRVSAIYPAPVLGPDNTPTNWDPVADVTYVNAVWGRYQIVFNGVDVTFFRGFASLLGTMVWNEPFGDNTLDVNFPQIKPWDLPGNLDLGWLIDGVDVEIYHVLADSTVDIANPMFEGRYVSEENTISARNTGTGQGGQQGTETPAHFFTAHCLGAIYCADLQVKAPSFVLAVATDPTTGNLKAAPIDLGTLLTKELNTRSQTTPTPDPHNRTIHLGICQPVTTGIDLSDPGSGTQLVNGYFQDLLAQGAVAPVPSIGSNVVGIAADTQGRYWVVADDSSVLPFGQGIFYGGSMLGTTLNAPFADIAVTPSGLGYWVVANDGGVFSFGDAQFYGEEPTPVSNVIGIAATPDGGGYWLIDDTGHVYSFGDAVYHGGVPAVAAVVGISAAPTGSGYYAVDANGHVYAFGSAVYAGGGPGNAVAIVARTGGGYWVIDAAGDAYGFGGAPSFVGILPNPLNAPIVGAVADGSGGLLLVGADGGVFTLGTAQFYGSVPGQNGQWESWTLNKAPGRVPVIQLKDRWTVHATMRAGQPGLQLSTLLRDPTTSRNAIYGEGTDTKGHAWRNTKYPNLRPYAVVPTFGGNLGLGTVSASVVVWQQAMFDAGWAVNVNVTSMLFDGLSQVACRAFQITNGLPPTGVVDLQTWNATWLISPLSAASGTNPDVGAYIAPLAEFPAVEPYLYDVYGGILGPNPAFNPVALRVEGWETFGTGVDKGTADNSALSELQRDGTAGYIGTITLFADPNEMSRYDLRAGMNLLLQNFRGRDVMLHIEQVSIAWNTQGRPVTLTVDEHAQDLVTVATMRTADRSTTDPVRRVRHNRRASRITDDVVSPWDFEAGGGIIPQFLLPAGLWQIVQIPAATAGTIVELDMQTSGPLTPFSVGIFQNPVQPVQLAAVLPNPLADPGNGGSAWDGNAAVNALGLVIGWGQNGDACGYSPLQEGGTLPDNSPAPLTGTLTDQGSWQFQSLIPPWLWVAIWAPNVCTVSGRLFPQPVDQ